MHIFFDESGDYAFPVDRFDCYVQAAVICPESALASAEAFVRDRCVAWSLDELHAHKLSATQLHEVAEFLADAPIELCVQLTDTVLTTPDVIQSCRLEQAAAFQRSITNYRRSGGDDHDIEADLRAHIKKAGLPSQISDSEFVHATLLIELVVLAIQRALFAYGADQWRDDFQEFHFISDGKLAGKMSAGEKYLSSKMVDLIASPSRHRFSWRPEWSSEPSHPWVERFCEPIPRVRRHQECLLTITRQKVHSHAQSVLMTPDGPPDLCDTHRPERERSGCPWRRLQSDKGGKVGSARTRLAPATLSPTPQIASGRN